MRQVGSAAGGFRHKSWRTKTEDKSWRQFETPDSQGCRPFHRVRRRRRAARYADIASATHARDARQRRTPETRRTPEAHARQHLLRQLVHCGQGVVIGPPKLKPLLVQQDLQLQRRQPRTGRPCARHRRRRGGACSRDGDPRRLGRGGGVGGAAGVDRWCRACPVGERRDRRGGGAAGCLGCDGRGGFLRHDLHANVNCGRRRRDKSRRGEGYYGRRHEEPEAKQRLPKMGGSGGPRSLSRRRKGGARGGWCGPARATLSVARLPSSSGSNKPWQSQSEVRRQ